MAQPLPHVHQNGHAAPDGGVTGLVPESRVPLYHQIYVVLRNRIVSGQIEPGARLPGEQDLAETFGVSRITAKRALNELATSGLVIRERGRGTRVVPSPPRPAVRTALEGWLENISLMGVATDATVLEFDYVPATKEVAEALDLAEGDSVQRAVRVRSLAGESLSYLTTWLPREIGEAFDADDLQRLPLLHLLERGGIKVSAARQTVTATLADPAVAAALAIDAGAPLLEVSRIVSDTAGRPVEYIRVLYRPDRYQFEMDLKRVGDEESMRWAAGPDPALGNEETNQPNNQTSQDRRDMS
ncbi:MAG: GntR family transcriptional regulator [Pseudomonadota bacterium]